MATDPIVFIVDDDPPVRAGLKWLIESVDLTVKTYGSAPEFLADYADEAGCLVLDVRLPGMSGLELQAEMVRRGFSLPIIVMSGHADVPMAVRALTMGAVDFIEKPISDQVLLDRVQQAIRRDQEARSQDVERSELMARVEALTPREREVMDLLIDGLANKEVAHELGLSTRTVEGHRAHLMEKLRVGSLAGIVRIGLRYREATSTK